MNEHERPEGSTDQYRRVECGVCGRADDFRNMAVARVADAAERTYSFCCGTCLLEILEETHPELGEEIRKTARQRLREAYRESNDPELQFAILQELAKHGVSPDELYREE